MPATNGVVSSARRIRPIQTLSHALAVGKSLLTTDTGSESLPTSRALFAAVFDRSEAIDAFGAIVVAGTTSSP